MTFPKDYARDMAVMISEGVMLNVPGPIACLVLIEASVDGKTDGTAVGMSFMVPVAGMDGKPLELNRISNALEKIREALAIDTEANVKTGIVAQEIPIMGKSDE